MNYYKISKEHVKVLHKPQPKYFQIALDKLSVMRFQLVEIETYFNIMFVLCKDTEILYIKENYK